MMKLNVLFVLAALQLANVEARAPPKFRRSLSFGPTLTHSRFETLLQPAHFSPSKEAERPLDVAREHLTQLYPPTEQVSWEIRPDSYTDARTGVTHVYAVQRVNGLPVADGVINLNIKDGRVISIGDSFYTGAFPHDSPVGLSSDALSSTQLAFCDQIAARPEPGQASPQMPMISEHGSHGIHPSLADVEQHNCGRLNLAQQLSHLSDDHYTGDARAAALSFMIHATHDQEVAEGIANMFDSHYKQLRVTAVHSVTGHPEQHIDGVPGVEGPVKAYPAYIQTPTADGTSSELNLVWKLEVKMADNWYDAAVSAINPAIIFSVADWVSDSPYYPQPEGPSNVAVSTRLPTSRLGRPVIVPLTDHKLSKGGPHTYNVFPWGVNDPSEGKRAVLQPQFDTLASPVGWHSINSANDPSRLQGRAAPVPPVYINYTTTFGNNVFAQENWEGRSSWLDNYRPISTTKWPSLTFDYPYNPKAADDGLAEAQQWINNTITELFYTSNMIHDIFYRYGFDEVSGNFQQYNFGRGGQENDAVIANAQDGSGYNNANFATPPDGSNGRCRMYLWNTAAPYRDGDLEAGIVIHEFAHGLSTRLTGGPSDSSCLAFGEGGGMGEGWGDFLATMIRANEEYSDYPMGSWAANMDKGIRNYPYSLDFTINPSTYKFLDKPGYWGVHAIGEVWAEILWVIAQKFIAKHGFSSTLFPPLVDPATGLVPGNNDFYRPRASPNAPLVPKHGNTLIVQLVFNGMKLQPCRPGFFEARDAIIQADEILTGGENLCELWEGFSERGLGPDATVVGKTPWGGGIRKDDFSVPQACRKEKKKPKKLWF